MFRKFVIIAVVSFVVALSISMTASYLIQTNETDQTTEAKLNVLLDDVTTLINDNTAQIKSIRTEMDAIYLEKTRAVAEMIKLNPELVYSIDDLTRICDILNIDEIHIIDENGILQWGTIEGYFGFPFRGDPQTEPFLEGLTNPYFELAQDPQPNATLGLYFQYIGVARYDQIGVIQIGMRPARLEEALHKAAPGNILNQIKTDKTMRILLISNDTIVGDSYNKISGTALAASGISNISAGSGSVQLDGTGHYVARKVGDYLAVSIISDADMYGTRNSMLVTFLITNALILFFLIFEMGIWITNSIIRPLNRVSRDVEIIAGGDLERRVDVQATPEFRSLSDSLNAMVNSIKTMLNDSEMMTDRLSTVMSSVEDSTEEMSRLLEDVHSNAITNDRRASDAGDVSRIALQNADIGSQKMADMVSAVQAIDDASQDIAKVMKTIDDIAFQTSILALNAAVEAARAGDYGSGFAVVAEEVRRLATKSAEAAKQTEQLINSSIQRAHTGVQIAHETAGKITEIVDDIRKSATLMEGIVTSSQEQVVAVGQLREGMDHIQQSVETTGFSAEHAAPHTPALNAPQASRARNTAARAYLPM